MRILYHSHSTLTMPEFFTKKAIKKFDKKVTKAAIEKLVRNGVVKKTGKNSYAIHPSAPLYKGTISQNPKGFGFVIPHGVSPKTPKLDNDLFIPPSKMAGCIHGDTVLVVGSFAKKGKRSEGAIVDILEKRINQLCGVVSVSGHEIFVHPDDSRFPFKVSLKERQDLPLKNGDAVIAEYKRPTKPTKTLSGKLIKILGDSSEIDTQMEMVISSHDLPHTFSDELLQEMDKLKDTFPLGSERLDLRKIQHVTIDGATAKDFDDAVCVEKNKSGFRLYVSIADVSHYVTPGSTVDTEAYERGTSIYFPGRVIPMLPERLSNDLCSLVPGQDRYTVSAILDFDRAGKLIKKSFHRSLIHSHKRFTYSTVHQILVEEDPVIRKEHKPFLLHLKWAGELANVLREQRTQRGSIDFNLIEPFFNLDTESRITSISKAERNFAHQIIEEFMLAANEAVAGFFLEKDIEALYRTHERPDESKLEEFLSFVKTLGVPLQPFTNDASWFANTLGNFKNTKYEYIVNNLLLRSLKQAQYTATNSGHFGLAASAYTHFTSPIRRYPDLIVHRLLLFLCGAHPKEILNKNKTESYKEAGAFLSSRERVAVTAERDMNDRLTIAFMKDKLGEHFSAIISGVTENSIYIVLDELCISGAVPVELLTDDYYILDKKNYRLFGEISATTYQIGDSVQVCLVNVDQIKKRLTFKMAPEE
ncbi:ribonuclease R [Desulforhopalus sp. 52FAK]